MFNDNKEMCAFYFLLNAGLREMLLSDENQLMKPDHQNKVYQDMTQPLAHYWINTSHNT